MNDPSTLNRRQWLRRGTGTLATLAMPWTLDLAGLAREAAAQATGDDYKALVCVFLFGGSDYANTVVTYDAASHEAYRRIRAAGNAAAPAGIFIERARLAATELHPSQPLPGGRAYALNPAMPGLARLFDEGQAAVLLNVGPLVRPTTREQYHSADRQRYPLPPQLFSHNDQVSVWQAFDGEGSTTGWGGLIGDELGGRNVQPAFGAISAGGNSIFVSGRQGAPYAVTTEGAVDVYPLREAPFGWEGVRAAMQRLVTEPRTHRLEEAYSRVMRRSLEAEARVSAALAPVRLGTPFPPGRSIGDTLAAQLQIIARLIGAREALGAKRQVFFAILGGFDLHDTLVSRQPGLLQSVSEALTAFHAATVELGVADRVTAFTASDFGRTLTSNGDGSDHGWGNHHFIVGGAVRGGLFYGTPPPVSVGNGSGADDQWHVGQGRLLPTTSVEQYGATLARWLGVPDERLDAVLPNLRHFGSSQAGIAYPRDLGFMR